MVTKEMEKSCFRNHFVSALALCWQTASPQEIDTLWNEDGMDISEEGGDILQSKKIVQKKTTDYSDMKLTFSLVRGLIVLKDDEITIGRSNTCTFSLTDKRMSSHHCKITKVSSLVSSFSPGLSPHSFSCYSKKIVNQYDPDPVIFLEDLR